MFYASDGANFQNDREAAAAALAEIGKFANYVGYVETAAEQQQPPLETETALLFEQLQGRDRRGRALRADHAGIRVGCDPRVLQPARRGGGASMNGTLHGYASRLEALAREHGLDYYPVQFEEVPSSFMMEIAVYGLPVRMPHWSFGVRYIYQLVQHRMGHSRLFEVVFPGNPGRAYLAGNNSLQENTLVTAHVLGHADFAKNNSLFKRSQEQVGYRIVEQAATHARQIGVAIEQHGQTRVEQVLDAALALEAHIDPFQSLRRHRYPEYVEPPRGTRGDAFQQRFDNLPGGPVAAERAARARARERAARARSAICSGSSRSTHRSSRSGSATSFARCARSRSTSIRCSRARS